MKIKDIITALERFAPLSLQDSFDNAGLQVGSANIEARGALLCLDITEEVLDEAISLGCNLVISHHPLIFKGYKSLSGKDYVERCIIKAIKNDLVIYSAHTNLDNVQGGVNYKIAEKIGLKRVKILCPAEEKLVKLVTFVPNAQVGIVRKALFTAGCGNIGNYDSCSYNIRGEGTFRAKEGARPFCGEIGALHYEQETRIETIFPAYKQDSVIKSLLAAHPYEEPVVDLYSLKNRWGQAGSGVIGELEEAEDTGVFLSRLKHLFDVQRMRTNKYRGEKIKRIALCGGSGAFLIQHAIRQGADAFITGEIKYHEFFGYDGTILIAEIGHYESEQYTKEIIYSVIKDLFPNFALRLSAINTNPIKYL